MTTSEIINLVLAIASFICSIVSIIVAIVIFNLQKHHEKEIERLNESRRYEEIKNTAKKFIVEHDDSIEYMPLCIVAVAYNNHHKYNRKIYNDFNMLLLEEQKEVIKQLKYEDFVIKGNHWIDKGIEKVITFIEEYKLGSNVLYDNAKYFHRALNYSKNLCHDYGELDPLFKDVFDWKTKWMIGDKGLTFSQYYDAYLKRVCIEKDVRYLAGNYSAPIDAIIDVKNLINCNADIVCFWMMIVVQVTCAKIINRYQYFHNGVELNLHFSGDACIETFEDKYLQILLDLYDVYQLKEEDK